MLYAHTGQKLYSNEHHVKAHRGEGLSKANGVNMW